MGLPSVSESHLLRQQILILADGLHVPGMWYTM